MWHFQSLFVLSAMVVRGTECHESPPQSLSIFNSPDCEQAGFYYTVTSQSGAVSPTGNSSDVSVKVIGLWKLQPRGCVHDYLFVNGLSGSCLELSFDPPCNDSRVGILYDRFGSEDLGRQELFLYDNENLTGRVFKIRNDSFTLNSSIIVKSFHMTGDFTWITYEETNFTGPNVTLLPSRGVSRFTYGVTFKTAVNFKVGSVRLRSQEPVKEPSAKVNNGGSRYFSMSAMHIVGWGSVFLLVGYLLKCI